MERLPNGTKVTWDSQASGASKTKTGDILAFAPAGKKLIEALPRDLFDMLYKTPKARVKFQELLHGRVEFHYQVIRKIYPVWQDSYIVRVHRGTDAKGRDKGYDYYKPCWEHVRVVEEVKDA